MAMQIAKKSSRPSEAKITISVKHRLMSFSAGICRAYNLTKDNHKYALVGFDESSKDIGIGFLDKVDAHGNAMKLTWTPKKTSFSFPVRSLLTSFSLDIGSIAGSYSNDDAITGPVKIDNFSKESYLLHTTKRSRT